ncbi:MAG: glycosyltransferase family 4 protein [Methanotrichaceae archaeon]|nr:glycosyltransferase family 4 protein [Methanotrichaceae archaeon]
MRVLHIGNIASVPQELSKAQRKLGLKSDVISFQPHAFKYEVDIYRPTKLPFPLKYAERLGSLYTIAESYDIFHFHWSSAVPFGIDLPIWKRLGKKIVLHHHGDDIRQRGEAFFYSKFANHIFVSTPDLLEWSPNAIWIPNPIDLQKLQYIGAKEHSGSLRVVHAPSDRTVKGTDHVIRAIGELKKEGYNVEMVLIENQSYHEAISQYGKADIAVDQLLVGWYGVFAIECMALGKPVCVYIKKDLESLLSASALINTSVDNLKENLRILLEDSALRKKIGLRARNFVEQSHDSNKIARMINDIYLE